MGSLADDHRPQCFADVVGQDAALKVISRLARRGLAGRALWIRGQSGTGKTTIARLCARQVADVCIEEMDAADLTAEELRRIKRSMALAGLGRRSGRAYIVNEAHGLRAETTRRLLTMLEPIPPHVVWIFTTTNQGETLFDNVDAGPLLSRCVEVQLARRNLAHVFAERAHAIAEAEGLNGRPLADYLRLAKDTGNNLRAMLQRVEAGAMLGNAEADAEAEA